MKGLKTFLALLLCLSVLLSGCITMGTEMFKSEPRSVGDWVIRVWGGLVDLTLVSIAAEYAEYTKNEAAFYGIFVGGGIDILLVDIAMRNELSYRKAYYQDKESEEEATKPDEESSEESSGDLVIIPPQAYEDRHRYTP